MFLGEFAHTIDDKGRLTIPAKFREELVSGIVITRGLDGCLWAYSRSEWEILAGRISQMPTTNRPARNFARFMFSSAFANLTSPVSFAPYANTVVCEIASVLAVQSSTIPALPSGR